MYDRERVIEEFNYLGSEYGHDLAAALMRASRNADREEKWQMSRLVLGQIEVAAMTLRNAWLPEYLTEIYVCAAKQGVHRELMKDEAIAAEISRRAA